MKRLTKTVGTLGLLGCAVIVSPCAVADDSGWYGGVNVGKSKATIDDTRISNNLGGSTATSISDNSSDTGYKLFGGYQFNRHFALEAGYFNLGKYGFNATTTPAGTLTGNTKMSGVNLDAIGILPLTEKFSAFGRFGVEYAEAKDNFVSGGFVPVPANPNPSKNAANFKAGVGVQYDFTRSFGMRAEAERYRIDDAVGNQGDINLISVGLVYRFGVKKPVPAPAPVEKADAIIEPVAAPAPQPVVETPPPAPLIVAAVVPAPVLNKIVISSDSSAGSLFEFGTATVNSSDKEALDKFVADLKGADFEVITVTGHTDRIGSFAYNMKLSKRRAEAVTAYLVATGIPSEKIKSVGMGDSDPVTKSGECTGKKETRKLIACLGPDRRVEVVVSATRISNEIASTKATR